MLPDKYKGLCIGTCTSLNAKAMRNSQTAAAGKRKPVALDFIKAAPRGTTESEAPSGWSREKNSVADSKVTAQD